MAWFGSSLSGQLSNLSNMTKAILTEGTEEISDPETELRLAKEKIEELQSFLTSQKLESDRIKKLNKELEEKVESSELQINAISREYRGVLESKEKEINALKKQQSELLEQQAHSAATSLNVDDSNSHSAFEENVKRRNSFNYDGEVHDWDFDDSIQLQRENNQLRSELQKATAEAKHWRSVAGQLGKKHENEENTSNSSADVLELQQKVNQLESSLAAKGEQLQQQATSLHEHHQRKVATLKQRQEQEVKVLKEKLAAVEAQLSETNNGAPHSGTLPESDRPNFNRQAELEKKLADALSEKDKAQNARIHLEGVLEELQQEVERLQDLNEKQEEQDAQSNAEVQNLQQKLVEQSQQFEKLEEENQELKSTIETLQGQAKNEALASLVTTKGESDDLKSTFQEVIATIGDPMIQQKTADLFNVIDNENLMLKEKNAKLEEQVILLEKMSSNQMMEKQSLIMTVAGLKSDTLGNQVDPGSDSHDTVNNELSNHNSTLADNDIMNAEISKLKTSLEKLEKRETEWGVEKVTLEDSIVDLQEQCKNQEDEILSLKSSGGSIQQCTKTLEKDKVGALEKELDSLKEENSNLEKALEELDNQHSEALSQLIEQRDRIMSELSENRTKIDHYEAEVKSLNELIEKMKEESENERHINSETLKQYEEELQKWKDNAKEAEKVANKVNELKEKLEKTALVINDLHMDKQELQSELKKVHDENHTSKVKLKESLSEKSDIEKMKIEMEERVKEMEMRLMENEIEFEKWHRVDEDKKLSASEQGNEASDMKSDHLSFEIDGTEQKNETANENSNKLFSMKESACSDIFEGELKVRQKLEQEENILQESKDYIDKLRRQRKELKVSVSALKAEHSNLERQFEFVQNEKEEYVSKLVEKEEELKCKEYKLSDLKINFDTLQSEKCQLQDHCENLEKDKANLEISIATRGRETNDYAEEIKRKSNEMSAEIEKLKEEAEVLKQSILEKENNISALRNDNELHLNELDSSKKKIDELEKLCKEKMQVVEGLEENLSLSDKRLYEVKESLKSMKEQAELEKSEKEELCKKLSDLEAEVEELKVKKESSASTISQLEAEINNLKQQGVDCGETMEKMVSQSLLTSNHVENADCMDDGCDKFQEIEKELEHLRKKLQDKDVIVSDLQRSNSSLLELMDKNTDSDHNERLAVHKLEAELRNLRAEREQMVAVVSEKSRENSSLKSEIHRLMELVSAGQAALAKSQQDNLTLDQTKQIKTCSSDDDDEMKREALNNMARLIRDKDTEIEALMQKNQTLLSVLQESSESQSAAALGPILKEKEALAQQVNTLVSEREQLIACITQKHSESLAFHAEVQRLTSVMVETQEAADKIKAEYAALIPSFEGKAKSLLSVQQELVECRQKLKELEISHGELIQRTKNQQHGSNSQAVDELEAEIEKFKALEKDHKATILEQSNQIQSLTQKLNGVEDAVASKQAECAHLKKQLDNSKFQLTGLMAEIADAKSEKELVRQKSESQGEESQHLRNSLNQLTLAVKDKDVEISALKEQLSTVNSVLQNKKGQQDQVSQLIRDHELALANSRQLQQEKDSSVMLADQRLQECQALKTELSSQKDKVFKLERELERLRSHLLEIEEGYTNEALGAEEREKELRNRLAVAEEQLASSSSHVKLASQEAQRQIESLESQLHTIASQRDAAYMQVASTQEQCQQYASSLTNLQLVLEHFQKEKNSAIALETEKYQEQAKSLDSKVKELEKELNATRTDLTEALDGLEAASRLSEQIDRKEEALRALKEEVQLREHSLKSAEEEIKKLHSNKEAKVDKDLMHNMVMTWLTSPEKKRHEIVQLIGHILGFSAEDFSKIEAAHSQNSLWIGLFNRSNKTESATPTKANQSFSQLFVKFLERESTPAPAPVKLPAEAMAAEAQNRHKQTFNPFMAPRHVSHTSDRANSSLMGSGSSSSHLLLPQDNLHPSPLFAPVTSGHSTAESAILKDVLDLKR